jgi:(p)ppGpp synthase/HD superfamily hydrolase
MEIMAALSGEDDLDGDLAIQCALLHDVIEDVGIKYDNLKNKFGIKVADGVNALSKNKAIKSKREQMIDSLERIKSSQRRSGW